MSAFDEFGKGGGMSDNLAWVLVVAMYVGLSGLALWLLFQLIKGDNK